MDSRRRSARLRAAALVAAVVLWVPSASAEIQKRPIGPLQEAVYGFAVAEYCGLLNPVVAEGFHLERQWIVARDGISPEREYADRIAAIMAADWQYGDHGLGGYRGWCRSEGMTAVNRFLTFREAILGK
ncbi:MAG: hypothetical protein K0S81_2468 [Rhodospirillales bacterium]|jgi:hypothetical protein|nr:hypothetical protein [Rhodospirillales bacterium]